MGCLLVLTPPQQRPEKKCLLHPKTQPALWGFISGLDLASCSWTVECPGRSLSLGGWSEVSG